MRSGASPASSSWRAKGSLSHRPDVHHGLAKREADPAAPSQEGARPVTRVQATHSRGRPEFSLAASEPCTVSLRMPKQMVDRIWNIGQSAPAPEQAISRFLDKTDERAAMLNASSFWILAIVPALVYPFMLYAYGRRFGNGKSSFDPYCGRNTPRRWGITRRRSGPAAIWTAPSGIGGWTSTSKQPCIPSRFVRSSAWRAGSQSSP